MIFVHLVEIVGKFYLVVCHTFSKLNVIFFCSKSAGGRSGEMANISRRSKTEHRESTGVLERRRSDAAS